MLLVVIVVVDMELDVVKSTSSTLSEEGSIATNRSLFATLSIHSTYCGILTKPARLSGLHIVTDESFNPVKEIIPRAIHVPLTFTEKAPPLSPLHTLVPRNNRLLLTSKAKII